MDDGRRRPHERCRGYGRGYYMTSIMKYVRYAGLTIFGYIGPSIFLCFPKFFDPNTFGAFETAH